MRIQGTGMGISENEKEKTFRAYYCSPNGLEEKGDGIGLYIVKENIQRIHGGIEVESKLGVGSTFIVNIPLKIEKE